MVGFIGWLALEREAGRRNVSSTSIPQYLSAARQMQIALTGLAPPQFPYVKHVHRAYKKWEEEDFPKLEVRMGITADVVQRIWYLGMTEHAGLPTIRDAAMVVFSYCMNELRESSVISIQESGVEIDGDRMTARISVLKGKPASQAQLVSYSRIGDLASPLDLWKRWAGARSSHQRFFAMSGDPLEATAGTLTRALERCLQKLSVSPTTGGKFTSHSLRIGAHTEQVLLHIPYEVRLARFGWGPRSHDMPSLYFDRTITTTAASLWIFGPPRPISTLPLSRLGAPLPVSPAVDTLASSANEA